MDKKPTSSRYNDVFTATEPTSQNIPTTTTNPIPTGGTTVPGVSVDYYKAPSSGYKTSSSGGGGTPTTSTQEEAINALVTPVSSRSTEEGYVLSTGERTQDIERAKADVITPEIQRTQRQVSTTQGYTLASGEQIVPGERYRAEIEAKELEIKNLEAQKTLIQPAPSMGGFSSTPGTSLEIDRKIRQEREDIKLMKKFKITEEAIPAVKETTKERMRRILPTLKEVTLNTYNPNLVVNEEHKGTFWGDAATVASQPFFVPIAAFALTKPEILATGAKSKAALRVGGVVAKGLTTSFLKQQAAARATDKYIEKAFLSKEQESLINPEWKYEITTKAKQAVYGNPEEQLNAEFEAFDVYRGQAEVARRAEGTAIGLSGAELETFAKEQAYTDMRKEFTALYKSKDYTEKDIANLEKRYAAGERYKSFNVPIVGNILNPKQIALNLIPGGYGFIGRKEGKEAIRRELQLRGVPEDRLDKEVEAYNKLITAQAANIVKNQLISEGFSQAAGIKTFKALTDVEVAKGTVLIGKKQIEKNLIAKGLIVGAASSFEESVPGYYQQTEDLGMERTKGGFLTSLGLGLGTAAALNAGSTGFSITRPKTAKAARVAGLALDLGEVYDYTFDIPVKWITRRKEPSVYVSTTLSTIQPGGAKTLVITPGGEQTVEFAPTGKQGKTTRIKSPSPFNIVEETGGVQPNVEAPGVFGGTTESRQSRGKGKGGVATFDIISMPTETKQPVNVPEPIKNLIHKGYKTGTGIFNPIGVPEPTNIKEPQPYEPDPGPPIPEPIPEPTKETVPQPTQTKVPTSIGIPVITPVWRALPPVMPVPSFDFGKNFGTGSGNKGLKYVNELAFSYKVFGAVTGSGPSFQQPKKQTKKEKKAQKKQSKAAKAQSLNSFTRRMIWG